MKPKKAFAVGKPALVKKSLLLLALLLLFNAGTFAQTTAFTYQGRLTDGGTPANGNYDLQFTLFDSLSGGTQVGSPQLHPGVPVSAGVFTVTLNFANTFPGADRFLEISARQAGSASFTLLTPRQQITSTPYAVRSLNASSADTATQLGGVAASQYVQTNDARLTDARSPTAGSSNYIQNGTSQQATSNFNISGNGTAGGTISGNIVNAATHYNLIGGRVLSAPGNNLFAGFLAGQNTTGDFNSFGEFAGQSNTTGGENSFFGQGAGVFSTKGNSNAFFGSNAGFSNTTGGDNTIIGAFADVGSGNLTNATAIGASAKVTQSNSLVLGDSTIDTKVGIGTTAPTERLTVKTGTASYGFVHTDGTITVGSFVGGSTGGGWYGTKSNHSLSFFVNNGSPSLTIDTGGAVSITTLGAAGSTQLCRNASNQISTCSSSLRYKTRVTSFVGGLDIVNRLRPIAFTWKDHPERDLGFGAEDVAAVEPLLVTHNANGQVEGVKYDRLTAVLVNAVQQQQRSIAALQQRNAVVHQENTQLKARLDRLEQAMGALRTAATKQRGRRRHGSVRQ